MRNLKTFLLPILVVAIANITKAQSVKASWSEPEKLTTWISETHVGAVTKDGVYVWEQAFQKRRPDNHIYKLFKFDPTLVKVYEKEIKKEDNDDDYKIHTTKRGMYISMLSFNKKEKIAKLLVSKLNEVAAEPEKWIEIASFGATYVNTVKYNMGFNSDSTKMFMAYIEKTDAGARLGIVNIDENLKVLSTFKQSDYYVPGKFEITSIIQTSDDHIIVAGNEYNIIPPSKKDNAKAERLLQEAENKTWFDARERIASKAVVKVYNKNGSPVNIKGLADEMKNSLNAFVAEISPSNFIVSGFTTNNFDSLTINGTYFIRLNTKSATATLENKYPVDQSLFKKATKDIRRVMPMEGFYNVSDSSIYLVAEEQQYNDEIETRRTSNSSLQSSFIRKSMNGDLFIVKKKLGGVAIDVQKVEKAQFATREYANIFYVPEELTTFFNPAETWTSPFRLSYFVYPEKKGLRFIFNSNANTKAYKTLSMAGIDFERMRNSDCYYAAAFNDKPIRKVILSNSDGFIANPKFKSDNTFYFLSTYTHTLGKDEYKLGKVSMGKEAN